MRSQGLTDKIYEQMLDKIIHCTYKPGSEINELKLTEEFGVSRTPVREAVARLEMHGYLKVLPKKGIYVTEVTLDTALQIFQVRLEIEPIALKLAVPYMDIRDLIHFRQIISSTSLSILESFQQDMNMHLYIIEHCGNHYIINMMKQVFQDSTRVAIYTGQDKVKIHTAMGEHLEILNHLIDNAPVDETAMLMRRHIESCRTAALNYFSSDAYLSNHEKLV
ncbi:MAG: GntR family transcriptional regulator [Eubacterium sp.]